MEIFRGDGGEGASARAWWPGQSGEARTIKTRLTCLIGETTYVWNMTVLILFLAFVVVLVVGTRLTAWRALVEHASSQVAREFA
jgi:hypothetical protein